VLSQTLPASEIIVVDDGSSDQSKQFIRDKYPDVHLLTQQHQGVSAARNLGIREASGEWLALLDSDDAWLAEKLDLQYQGLSNDNTYKIIHTNEIWIRNDIVLKQKGKHRKQGGNIFQCCLPLCAMSPSSIMIHRDVFDDIGLFDENLPVCEDYDLWLRICSRYPVLFLEQALIIKYGGHDDQLSQQYWGMDRFRIRALAKILETEVLNEDDRKATVKMILEKISLFLKGAIKHDNNQYCYEFKSLQQKYSAGLPD
jgi:glycosyltransferase involved in cell wall biosynthesis